MFSKEKMRGPWIAWVILSTSVEIRGKKWNVFRRSADDVSFLPSIKYGNAMDGLRNTYLVLSFIHQVAVCYFW